MNVILQNLKAGEIVTKETQRGIEFHAWNHERQRLIHIGTLSGRTYEKGNVSILRKPEPSISLPQSEYGAAVEAGALYLRCLSFDKITYAISLADFKANAVPYFNAGYGRQWRCSLSAFERIAAVQKRNSRTDNPVSAIAKELLPRQLSMFGGGR